MLAPDRVAERDGGGAVKIHPDAEVFPLMSDDEFQRLADSIEKDGLLEPITLLDDQILDGRHRDRACEERGIESSYVEWDPSCGITPLEWVIARNLHRRQLSIAQRAALAVELEARLASASRERMRQGGKRSGETRRGKRRSDHLVIPSVTSHMSRELAGAQFGVSGMSVQRIKQIRGRDPVVFDRIKKGEIGVGKARQLVGLPTESSPRRKTKQSLNEALAPFRSYLKNWDEERLYGVTPREARRLLRQVQEVDAILLEVERALENRSVVSRALR